MVGPAAGHSLPNLYLGNLREDDGRGRSDVCGYAQECRGLTGALEAGYGARAPRCDKVHNSGPATS